jgi:hypothetical protein
VAVKDRATNTKIVELLDRVLQKDICHDNTPSAPAIAAPAR